MTNTTVIVHPTALVLAKHLTLPRLLPSVVRALRCCIPRLRLPRCGAHSESR